MQLKRKLPRDTIAIRQIWAAGAISLPVGFFAVSVGLFWLWRALDHEPFWSWNLISWVIYSLEFGLIGGLGLGVIVMSALGRIHYRLGWHRSVYCGRPLRGIGKPCSCPAIAELSRANAAAADRTVA